MLVVYWIIINRTTLGFEVRRQLQPRVGPPAASRSPATTFAMAISGRMKPRGCDDITWEYRIGETTSGEPDRVHRLSRGPAGEHRRRGRLHSLLFGALINGTSGRQLTRRSSVPIWRAT
jgi:hypothetical protein